MNIIYIYLHHLHRTKKIDVKKKKNGLHIELNPFPLGITVLFTPFIKSAIECNCPSKLSLPFKYGPGHKGHIMYSIIVQSLNMFFFKKFC